MSAQVPDRGASLAALQRQLDEARRRLSATKAGSTFRRWVFPAKQTDTVALSALAGQLAGTLSQVLRPSPMTDPTLVGDLNLLSYRRTGAIDDLVAATLRDALSVFRELFDAAVEPRVSALAAACKVAALDFDRWTSGDHYPQKAFDNRLFKNMAEIDRLRPSTPVVSASEAARFDGYCAKVQATLQAMVRRLEPLAGEQQDLYRIVEPLDQELTLAPHLLEPGSRTDLFESAVTLGNKIAGVRDCTSAVEQFCESWLARDATRLATGDADAS